MKYIGHFAYKFQALQIITHTSILRPCDFFKLLDTEEWDYKKILFSLQLDVCLWEETEFPFGGSSEIEFIKARLSL